jgi:hypothetical protein
MRQVRNEGTGTAKPLVVSNPTATGLAGPGVTCPLDRQLSTTNEFDTAPVRGGRRDADQRAD